MRSPWRQERQTKWNGDWREVSIQSGEQLKGQREKVNLCSHPPSLLSSLFFWELPRNWNLGTMTVLVVGREQLTGWCPSSEVTSWGSHKGGNLGPLFSHRTSQLDGKCYRRPLLPFSILLFLSCGSRGDSRREGWSEWEGVRLRGQRLRACLVGWDSAARLPLPLVTPEPAITERAINMDTSQKGVGRNDVAVHIPYERTFLRLARSLSLVKIQGGCLFTDVIITVEWPPVTTMQPCSNSNPHVDYNVLLLLFLDWHVNYLELIFGC